MYWDHNDVQSKPLVNGEVDASAQNTPESSNTSNSILLVYALDLTDKVVKLKTEPVLRRELPPEQAPIECILLPTLEKGRASAVSSRFSASSNSSNNETSEPRGQVALVCRDGAIRLMNLNSLNIIAETKLEGRNFISVAYCTSRFQVLF